MSWYSTGFGSEKEKEADAEREQKYGPNRVWMKPEHSKEYAFIDDEPFLIREFSFRKGKSWRGNHVTDPGPDNEASAWLVQELGDPYVVGFLTVIDCTGFKDRSGKTHRFNLELLATKSKARKILEKKKEQKGGLAGKMCTITRLEAGSPNTGDDFDFDREISDKQKMFEVCCYKGKLLSEMYDEAEKDPEKMVGLKRLFAVRHEDDDESKPLIREVPTFNYFEVCKPLSAEAIRKRVQGHDTPSDRGGKGGSDDKGSKTDQPEDDAVPF